MARADEDSAHLQQTLGSDLHVFDFVLFVVCFFLGVFIQRCHSTQAANTPTGALVGTATFQQRRASAPNRSAEGFLLLGPRSSRYPGMKIARNLLDLLPW